MSESLAGKVVVVTGASKGMGRVFAETLAGNGARVAALARPSKDLDTLQGALGDAVLPIACDISDADSTQAAIDRAAEHFGRIDALVNNAAISTLLKIETATKAEMDREVAVNLLGPVYACRAAIPHLRAAGGGDIIFISSESVRQPFPYMVLYAATKAGIEVVASGLRLELRQQRTRVTVLRSGYVSGGHLGDHWPEDRRTDFFTQWSQLGLQQFSGEPATPQSMAEALMSVLGLPRDINVDLIEVRGRPPQGG